MSLRLALIGLASAGAVALGSLYGLERKESARQRTRADMAEAALVATAKARTDERADASAAYESLAKTCTADFAAAISKGRTIERILQAPPPAAGAPRGLVSAGELRNIIGGGRDAAADSH